MYDVPVMIHGIPELISMIYFVMIYFVTGGATEILILDYCLTMELEKQKKKCIQR
jgi:hypothetical protein